MNIEIPTDQINFIQNSIHAGTYQSESEVVVAAISLLQRKEAAIKAIQAEILPAIERTERGEGIFLNDDEMDAYFDKILEEGLARNKDA